VAAAVDVINEVLALLEPMVASDGGSLRIATFSEEDSRLAVDYDKGVNDACATCVIDAESLQVFIDEGIRARGVEIVEIRVVEPGSRS
jgi:Fe-S cluster biogenesis protein NfuA